MFQRHALFHKQYPAQRWIAFRDIGPSPRGRFGHSMACDGTRVFVLGGLLSPGAQADETKLIHVLDTSMYFLFVISFGQPPSLKTQSTSITRNPTLTLSILVRRPPNSCRSRQRVPRIEDNHISRYLRRIPIQYVVLLLSKKLPQMNWTTSPQQITRDQNPSLNSLPRRLLWRPTGASGRPKRFPEDDDDGEGSTEHHAKVLAPDAPSGKEIARLEDGRLVELERQLSETLVAKTERDRRIARLTDDLALKSALLEQAVEEKERTGLELRELQAKLDESLLSRDHALEQAQSALQKASWATEANEQSQRELTEMRAELEASKSESAAFHLRLADTENGCAKSKAEADTNHTQTATGLANTDEDGVVHRLMERIQAMEAKMASSWNEKSFEMMECRNEG